MKLILKTIAVSVAVLALLAAGGYYFITKHSSGGKEIQQVAEKIEERQSQSTEKAGNKDSEADMEEREVQIHLHQMTHQKVVDKEKNGAVEMTDENIEGLLTIVNANKHYYENGDYYEQTLISWQQDDFSTIVSAHNTVWSWYSGTAGRATGRLSAEEEQQFIEKNFR
ncbi:hypothetical protein AUO94_04245 [Planococcus kocurii]|uniref:DUF4367 domain-containing protein n=1 Tax=Planococcus kocurii TaxID=1374 RepID=A0ABM5WUE9_9BACL|nr:DUF6241 domain-containing protein [Planococcus kocurii]ALS77902.1 hypothetical protein AUO94_04245 [Planococcus kocurii]